MKHRKSKLDEITEREHNNNENTKPNNLRSTQLPSQNHTTSSKENYPQRQREDLTVAWWNEECEREENSDSRIQKTPRPNKQTKLKKIPMQESH